MQMTRLSSSRMRTITAQANKHYTNKHYITIALASAWILAAGLLYSYSVQANTNATGVEIEYISEPEVLADPVQNLLNDMDAAHENNLINAADGDLWVRIKDGTSYQM